MRMQPNGNSDNAYHAYLLRIWQEDQQERPHHSWRFSLEDAQTGLRRGFSDLDTLLIFLQNLTNTNS